MATIRKNGKSWQAVIRKTGRKQQSKCFPLKRDAEAWANIVESEMIRGTFVDTATANATSLAQCLDDYEEEQTQAGRRSLKQLKSQLNIIRRSDLVKLSLANVTPSDIVKFQKQRMATGIKTATYIKDHNLLHTIFETIQRGWGIHLPKGNPVKLISKPKHKDPTSRSRRLNDGEEGKLLDYLENHTEQIDLVVRFALATGMRRGEILNIRFMDINTAKREINIPVTKTNHPRVIPMLPGVQSLIRWRSRVIIAKDGEGSITPSRLLFSVKPDSVTQAFARACKAQGIDGLTLHDCRHEAISRLFEQGLDMMEVSLISGHKSFDMLKQYTHLRPQSVLDKLQRGTTEYPPFLYNS